MGARGLKCRRHFFTKWIMYLAGVLGMAGMSIRIIQRRVGEFMNTGKEGAEV